jgi:hypothetical protein
MERSLTSEIKFSVKSAIHHEALGANRVAHVKIWTLTVSDQEVAERWPEIIQAFEAEVWHVNAAFPADKWIRSTSRKFEKFMSSPGLCFLGSVFATAKIQGTGPSSQAISHFFVEVTKTPRTDDNCVDEGGDSDDSTTT